MDTATVSLVQESWKEIEAKSDEFAELFYKNLFAINPDLQSLFKRSMTMQGRKMMSMFSKAVSCLEHVGSMEEPLKASGQRHHEQYGVLEKDYADVVAAWLMTIETMFGEKFQGGLQEAWIETLEIIQLYMTKDLNPHYKS